MSSADTMHINVAQMIDMAIGTPEVGVVDFNMLQSVLHVLAQQLHVLGKGVELRGTLHHPLFTSSLDQAQTVQVTEYLLQVEGGNPLATSLDARTVATNTSGDPSSEASQETVLVVERVKKKDELQSDSKRQGAGGISSMSSHPSGGRLSASESGGGAGTGGREGLVKIREPERRLSVVTTEKFTKLEAAVDKLKGHVYGNVPIPTNEDLLEDVRTHPGSKSITDMWTSLNWSSRIETLEIGMEKLGSLVQDLAGEIRDYDNVGYGAVSVAGGGAADGTAADGAAAGGAAADDTGVTGTAAGGGAAAAAGGVGAVTEHGRRRSKPFGATGMADSGGPINLHQEVEQLRNDVDYLKRTINELTGFEDELDEDGNPISGAASMISGKASISVDGKVTTDGKTTDGKLSDGKPAGAGGLVCDEFGGKKGKIKGRGAEDGMSAAQGRALRDRIEACEKKMKLCCEKIDKVDGLVGDQLNSFQDQLMGLGNDIATVTEKAENGANADLIREVQGLMDLFPVVKEIQEELANASNTVTQLASEKEERQLHMNSLLEQIELIKTIKMDREDMAEAMASKADARMLARKVSHDQFEMACDDLSRGLEHAVGKLTAQESLWQQALDDIQREIENKLDKLELAPVKEFFNNKLKQLQDNLKQMANLRREAEAAGTKRKFLRDVNCISCDARAIMATTEKAAVPLLKPLPAQLSMKPYLSYELDQIRKQQAAGVSQRNMHDWETIDNQMKQGNPNVRVRSGSGKHLCNRYCGGSHTVTNPAQRVARLGHFLRQWGPDVLPLTSGLAAGDDGKMYKVEQHGSGGKDGSKTSLKKGTGDATKGRSKNQGECRCLEDDAARG